MQLPEGLDLFVPEDRQYVDALLEDMVRHIMARREIAIHTEDPILKEPIREFGDLYNQVAARWPYHVLGFSGYVQMVGQIQQGARVMISKTPSTIVPVGH